MSSLAIELASRYGRWSRRFPVVDLRTLRWLTVILPAAFFIAVDYLRHFVFSYSLHDFPGFAILWGGGLLASLAFSYVVFGTIERMQKEVLRRNRELSVLHAAAYHQAEQLKALNEAGMALTAELSLEAVLKKVVDLSRDLAGARFGALAVFDEEKRIERFITSGLTQMETGRIGRLPVGRGVMAAVRDKGKPIRMADIRRHPLSVGFPANHPEMKTFLGVPIIAKGRVIGDLKLADKRGGEEFTQEDEDNVMMLARQAAIAIQNAKLYEQEQVLAVLQERERIAQDLHDGIIQDIYAIGLSLEQCIEQARVSPERLSDRLNGAVEDLNDIIRDVRNYIFALQPTDLQGIDLTAGLDNITREFRINSLVDAELVIQGNIDGVLAQVQLGHLFQIAREALTNVLKHARATAVTIEVQQRDDHLEMSVADNGSGFDPIRTSGSGHGLRNIAERARALGGYLIIDSGPDKGSTLTVRVPLAT